MSQFRFCHKSQITFDGIVSKLLYFLRSKYDLKAESLVQDWFLCKTLTIRFKVLNVLSSLKLKQGQSSPIVGIHYIREKKQNPQQDIINFYPFPLLALQFLFTYQQVISSSDLNKSISRPEQQCFGKVSFSFRVYTPSLKKIN